MVRARSNSGSRKRARDDCKDSKVVRARDLSRGRERQKLSHLESHGAKSQLAEESEGASEDFSQTMETSYDQFKKAEVAKAAAEKAAEKLEAAKKLEAEKLEAEKLEAEKLEAAKKLEAHHTHTSDT